jgi:hypothetical protein
MFLNLGKFREICSVGLISIPDWLAPVEEGMCFKIQGE